MFDETAFLDKTEGHIKSKLPTISTDRCEYNKIEDVSLSLSISTTFFSLFFLAYFDRGLIEHAAFELRFERKVNDIVQHRKIKTKRKKKKEMIVKCAVIIGRLP